MARRREVDLISMSMLDAITCGFGAVILFFMIITANIDLRSDVELEDRSAEAARLELQVEVGRENLAELREALAEIVQSMAERQVARDQLAAEIEKTEEDIRRLLEDENASEETIEKLRAELERLEIEKESLAAQSETVDATGNYIRQVQGEGYRQYLTGLSMGGQRILILVDASGSMLDTSLGRVAARRAEVLGRRAEGREAEYASPKWQQVVDSVDWLTAQIPPGTQFQVVAFNREAWAIIPGTDGQWLTADDNTQLDQAVETLRDFVPGSCRPDDTTGGPCGATSLHAAFAAMSSFVPSPDNVYLLTDGLPTMGEEYPDRAGVTGRERMEHFARATRGLPNTIPINVLLYALEGDPRATVAYWALALETGGSLMAPSEDWP